MTRTMMIVALVLTMAPGERPPPGMIVPCPAATADPARYSGDAAPYRCVSAVSDVFGNLVVLREGRASPAGFGLRQAHAANLGSPAIEAVVRAVRPRPAPGRRVRHVAQLHEPDGPGTVDVEVVVDRSPWAAAPDTEPFGLVGGFCRSSGFPGDVVRCPDWVDAAASAVLAP